MKLVKVGNLYNKDENNDKGYTPFSQFPEETKKMMSEPTPSNNDKSIFQKIKEKYLDFGSNMPITQAIAQKSFRPLVDAAKRMTQGENGNPVSAGLNMIPMGGLETKFSGKIKNLIDKIAKSNVSDDIAINLNKFGVSKNVANDLSTKLVNVSDGNVVYKMANAGKVVSEVEKKLGQGIGKDLQNKIAVSVDKITQSTTDVNTEKLATDKLIDDVVQKFKSNSSKQIISQQDKTVRNSLIDIHADLRKKLADAPNPDTYNKIDDEIKKIDDLVQKYDNKSISANERLTANELVARQDAEKQTLKYNDTRKLMSEEKAKSVETNEQISKNRDIESLKQDIQSGELKLEPEMPKGKARGFSKSIYNSPEVSPELGKKLRENPESYYGIKHNNTAIEKAQRKVFNNINEAERIATTETTDEAIFTAGELIKQYDTLAQKAKAKGDMAGFEAAMDKAVDVSLKSAENLTDAGRTVQAAASISRLSPDGIIKLVNKTIKKVGGKNVVFSNEEYYKIIRQAEKIQNTLDPKQRALMSFKLLDDIYSKIPTPLKNKVYETLNVPRAIMSSADFSAGFRQGIFVATRHPIKFTKAFLSQFKYAFSDKAYQNLKADIVTNKNYHLYLKYKLPLTDLQHSLSTREERFMSTWAEKIPGIGSIVEGSGRAYTGLLNKLRMDLMDDFIRTAEKIGIKDEKYFKDAADFIGAATGRGSWKPIEKAAPALNSIFFSPRLMVSRVKLLNPIYYTKLHPQVRKEALKSLLAFAGSTMTILGLAKLGGAKVGVNPNSADFGKIKIGNTRIDIMGGFQQYLRMASQVITGKYISTTTGKELTLGEGYNTPTRWDILMRQLEAKQAPIASLITNIMKGKDYAGKDINIPKEIANRFVPMVAGDIVDLAKEDPKLLPLGALGALGFGLQTYTKPKWEEATTSEKYQILKDMPANEANKKMAALKKTDKAAYTNIKKYLTWDKYNLTPEERGFSTLEIKDGTRPKRIYDYIMKQKNRKETYEKLKNAGIITDEVKKGIIELKKTS